MSYKAARRRIPNASATDRTASATKHIPFTRFLRPDILTNENADLISIFEIDGLVFETLDQRDINAASDTISAMLRQLADDRTAIYTHTIKYLSDVNDLLPGGAVGTEFGDYADDKYRAQLKGQKIYTIKHFLTIVRRPRFSKTGLFGSLARAITSAGGKDRSADEIALKRAEELGQLDTICDQISKYFSQLGIRRLTKSDPALMSMLGFLVNGMWRNHSPVDLAIDRALPLGRIVFGNNTAAVTGPHPDDTRSIAMLGVHTYTNNSSNYMFDDLLGVDSEFCLTQCFIPLDEYSARKIARSTRIAMEQSEDEAVTLQEELHELSDAIASRRSILGRHHITISVIGLPDTLSENISSVVSSLAPTGLKVKRETLGLEAAYWAQLPSNFNYQTRANHAVITGQNFADFSPFHAFSAGETRDLTWDQPITAFVTTSRTGYSFNFHNSGSQANGTFAIFGPAGTGKTALCNFLIAQSQKLEHKPRIIYFDKDLGSKTFIEAMDGEYHILAPGQASGFNPFVLCDTPEDASWLAGFLERISGLDLNDEQRLRLNDACLRNAEIAKENRTFSELVSLLGSLDDNGDFVAALREWHGMGDKAWLFDNPVDSFEITDGFSAVDMTSMLKEPRIKSATLDYIFFRIEKILSDGTPTIILLEEAWKLLGDDRFMARAQDWIKTIRKLNGILGFLTQEPSDASKSPICDTLISNTATQIFLANPKADTASYVDAFRLTDVEFNIVQKMRETQRFALIKKGNASTVIRMELKDGPLISVLSGSAKSNQRADVLRQSTPNNWLDAFMDDALTQWRETQ